MKKLVITQDDLISLVDKLCAKIDDSDFLPDRIVGLSGSGVVPATMISNYFGVPMTVVSWSSTQDQSENECNCWLPENAYNGEKILVVDSIVRTGVTMESLCVDWSASIKGLADYDTWQDNVCFVALHSVKNTNEFELDFFIEEIDSDEVTYPWENWWL